MPDFVPPTTEDALARLEMPLADAMRSKYGPTTRPPIREVVHIDRYGNQPDRD